MILWLPVRIIPSLSPLFQCDGECFPLRIFHFLRCDGELLPRGTRPKMPLPPLLLPPSPSLMPPLLMPLAALPLRHVIIHQILHMIYRILYMILHLHLRSVYVGCGLCKSYYLRQPSTQTCINHIKAQQTERASITSMLNSSKLYVLDQSFCSGNHKLCSVFYRSISPSVWVRHG